MLPLISKRTETRWGAFEVRQKVKTLTFKHAFLSCTLSQFPTCFLYVPKSISCLLTIYLFLVFLLGGADRNGNHICAEFVSSAAIKWVTWSHSCMLFGYSSWKTQLFLFHPKYEGNCFYTLLSIETCFFSADTNFPGSPPILPPSDVSEVNRIPWFGSICLAIHRPPGVRIPWFELKTPWVSLLWIARGICSGCLLMWMLTACKGVPLLIDGDQDCSFADLLTWIIQAKRCLISQVHP